MSELLCEVAGCDFPSGSLYLCVRHVKEYAALLAQVPELRHELYTTMAKLDHVGSRQVFSSSASKNPPMPLRERAMMKRGALFIWMFVDAREQARYASAGGELEMLAQMVKEAQAMIDLPKSRIIWGPCFDGGSCEGEISVVENSDSEQVAVCPVCSRLWTAETYAEARRDRVHWLLMELAPEPLRSSDVRKLLRDQMQVQVQATDLVNWVDRGLLRWFPDRVSSSQSLKVTRRYYAGEVLATYHRLHA